MFTKHVGGICELQIYIYIGVNKICSQKTANGKITLQKIKKEARKIIRQHLAAQLSLATTLRPHYRQYLPLPDITERSALSALSIPESR